MPDGRQLADRVLSAVNAHDLERLAECYERNAVLTTPWGVRRGREQIIRSWEILFRGVPDMTITVWNTVAGPEPCFSEWTITGTQTGVFPLPDGGVAGPSGRRIAVRGFDACRTENDLVVAHRAYFDLLELYSQLGFTLIPA
ncbi:MAG: ester cyclase [Microbispora sp.]|nr:ester cyclase [Microbispora sp.]